MRPFGLSFRWKLYPLILISLLGLLLGAYTELRIAIKIERELKEAHSQVLFLEKLSEVIHEHQKERGFSLGYLASKGAKFNSELTSQRKRTSQKIEALFSLKENPFYEEFLGKLLQDLSLKREEVMTLKITERQPFPFIQSLSMNLYILH